MDHAETQYEQAVADSYPRGGGVPITGNLTAQGDVTIYGDVLLNATGGTNWKYLRGLVLHRNRLFGQWSIIGDQQDMLALANREPNRTFTASPSPSGSVIGNVLQDDLTVTGWNAGVVTPIVVELDAIANPVPGAGYCSFGFTTDELSGYNQPTNVKIEAFNSGAYETVYNAAVVIRDGFGYVHHSSMTGAKI